MPSSVNIRVTSIWQNTKEWVCFSGVPIKSGSSKLTSGRQIIIVKTSPKILPLDPVKGQHWKITGDYQVKQATHGDYILTEQHWDQPERCEVTLPHDGENFIRFISTEKTFTGIGEVKARELWSKFGKSIFQILEKKDANKLSTVLTTNTIKSLFTGYEKYANLKHSTWFADHHIPPYIQQRLFKFHKDDAVQAIKDNPYNLISFGMEFEDIDKMAFEMFSIDENDSRRLLAAVEQALRLHSKKGHTYATHKDLLPLVSRILGSNEKAILALKEGHNRLSFVLNPKTGTYHSTALYIMEKVIAKRVNSLLNSPNFHKDQFARAYKKEITQSVFKLSDMQNKAVTSALDNNVSCITGGAGTGKTTVLRTILKLYYDCGFDIYPLALAGRAAMRLHESIGFVTFTIARFLRMEPIEKESKVIIVIDEASMLDLPTMYRLVIKTHPSVRFLFVGDPNQLPPIGAGIVLADLIKSKKVANVELDIVQRQEASTGIPEYSKLIKDGIVPLNLAYKNIRFHETSDYSIAQQCTSLYIQDSKDCQIIAPTKKLTKEINQLCQQQTNQESPNLNFIEYGEHYTTELKLNDPVLFTQNNYDAGVQNGSMGTLISIEQNEEVFAIVKLDDTNKEIKINKALLDTLELAYCITLHKAQGSQFKRVIVAINLSRMIDRAWIYTAITRSEVELHLVGQNQIVEKSIKKFSSIYLRKTYLSELII
jgi:exodeoxyribonuclease V alpha subunit